MATWFASTYSKKQFERQIDATLGMLSA